MLVRRLLERGSGAPARGHSDAWEKGAASAAREVNPMFLALFVILLLAWILGFVAFHVASGLIHLLLILAVISIIIHLVRGASAV